MIKTAVVIPNWNGKSSLGTCLDSLIIQSIKTTIIVVENGSKDGSLEFLQNNYPDIQIIINKQNLGFAGGVNLGIKHAIGLKVDYVALFNNDAVADKNWLSSLVKVIDDDKNIGIVTCKLLSIDKKHIDSTGDLYTVWGLPYPRGRGEISSNKYDDMRNVFAASGGASLYRTELFKDIGYFDEDFFAYYEDVDLSFRAQLRGWKIQYVPEATAFHQIGATSKKIKGFTTYHTMKNLPWLFWKNVPTRYLFIIGWRLSFAYFLFLISSLLRGNGWSAIKGLIVSVLFSPKKLMQRLSIQSHKQVKSNYIWDIIVHDLPPNASKLKALRLKWHKT